MKRCLGQIRDYVMTAANSATRGQLGFYGGHLRDIIARSRKKARLGSGLKMKATALG